MAKKSIKAAATLDNPAVTTGYQVKANPVNTFVSGSGNSRGQQVAEALSKVGGSLMNLANTNAQLDKEAERIKKQAEAKAYEATVLREKSRATILSSGWVEKLEQDTKNADLTKTTQAEWYAQWRRDNPAYDENLSSFTTEEAQLKFGATIGSKLNEYFTTNKLEQQKYADSQLISAEVFTKSKNLKGLSVNDPSFAVFVKDAEDSMVSYGYASRQSRYEMLHHIAKKMYAEQNDPRMYQWLMGEADGRMPIGNPKFQEAVKKSQRDIKTQINVQRNQQAADTAAALKVNQVKLAQDGAALFNSEVPVTQEQKQSLTQKYIDLGVPNAAQRVNQMASNYKTMHDVTLTPEEESRLWKGFLEAGDAEAQLGYVQAKVNKGEINRSLASQFYSRLGNRDNKTLLQGSWYTANQKAINRLTQATNPFTRQLEDSSEYSYLKPLFEQRYLQMATSAEWVEMTTDQKYDAMAKLIRAMAELKEVNDDDPENDMEQLKGIQSAQEAASKEQKVAQEDLKKRADDLQARIQALKAAKEKTK